MSRAGLTDIAKGSRPEHADLGNLEYLVIIDGEMVYRQEGDRTQRPKADRGCWTNLDQILLPVAVPADGLVLGIVRRREGRRVEIRIRPDGILERLRVVR